MTATGATTSEENGSVATASCPAGKHLSGTGGRVNNGANSVTIDDIRPNPSLTSVTVSGFETPSGYDEDWSVTAYAICVSA